MHRSRAQAGVLAPFLAVLFVGIVAIAPRPARGAEPEVGPLLDVAGEIATECDEYEPGFWRCVTHDERRSIGANVSDFDTSFQVSIAGNWFDVSEPVPAEADVFAAMQDIVSLILPGDAEVEAWLAEMNAGPQAQGDFVSGDWSLTWSAGMVDLAERVANITFDAFYFPTGEPIEPPSAAPAPSFEPRSLGPGELATSSLGEWTYQGDWTLTAFEGGNGQEADPPLGTTVPATLTIRCADETACTASSTDGVGFTELPFDLSTAGRLTSTRLFDRDDCGAKETHQIEIEHGTDRAIVTSSDSTQPLSCSSGTRYVYFSDHTWVFEGDLTGYVPVKGAESGQSPAPGPAAPGAPQDGNAAGGGLEFSRSVPTVADVSTDPIVVLQSAALAALLVFLMPFPSQLFNSTLETHEDEVRRWFRLDRIGSVAGGIGPFWASWPGVALFTLLAAVLYGFLDPGFGFNLGSLATFLGMLLGIVLVTVAFAIPLVLTHRRQGERPSLKVVPVSLLIGIACVLLSRLTDFQPGYLYGLLIGLAFARELNTAEEGRATAAGGALMLGVAFISWLALGALPESDAFGLVVARTALAALMVAGLEGVVFGLLPMRFLPGESLYRWNRALWAGLLLIGAFAFFHILINPASGYLSDTSRTPLLTVVALLVGFSLVSVAFWAWFRFRPAPPTPERST